MFWLVILTIAFLLVSGLLAAIDAAFLSVTRPEVEEMIHHGKRGALHLRDAKRKIARTVVVIVILTNTVNVLGPILVSRRAFELYGSHVIGIITLILTVGTILFSEILPKALGVHFAPVISRFSIPIIRLVTILLYPIVIALAWLSELFLMGKRQIGTEEQIRSLATIGRRAGFIEHDEGLLIHRAFVLNDRTAGDIMTPLDIVSTFRITDTIRDISAEVRRCIYSRYPVLSESSNELLGIVMARDVLAALSDGREDDFVTSIIRPGLVVSSDTRSDALLALFRDRHIHMAAVERQNLIVGIVTLEDVLEELVGDIEDEKDSFDRPHV